MQPLLRLVFTAGLLLAANGAVAGTDTVEDKLDAVHHEDYAKAIQLSRLLAQQGDAQAQFELGVMYFEEKGISKDYAEAVRWFRKAAEKGYAEAQYSLGVVYGEGDGVAQDYGEELKWLHQAAEQGLPEAQFDLGAIYEAGRLVPKDDRIAHMWYNLASAQGLEKAARNRDFVADHLTQSQIAEAQKMAREWIPIAGSAPRSFRAASQTGGGGFTPLN